MRRNQGVHRRQAGQGRDGDPHEGQLGPASHQQDDGDEQHQANLEEHRQANDGADEGHRPRQGGWGCLGHQRVDDFVGAAGIGEQLADDRAEGDEDAD